MIQGWGEMIDKMRLIYFRFCNFALMSSNTQRGECQNNYVNNYVLGLDQISSFGTTISRHDTCKLKLNHASQVEGRGQLLKLKLEYGLGEQKEND
jgi:hypothetical protein